MNLSALKAIGDVTRFKIIRLLVNHDQCVSGLSNKIGVSDAAISQHLSVLKEADLVRCEKKGYFKHYSLNRDLLEEVGTELVELAEREPITEHIHFKTKGKNCPRGDK